MIQNEQDLMAVNQFAGEAYVAVGKRSFTTFPDSMVDWKSESRNKELCSMAKRQNEHRMKSFSWLVVFSAALTPPLSLSRLRKFSPQRCSSADQGHQNSAAEKKERKSQIHNDSVRSNECSDTKPGLITPPGFSHLAGEIFIKSCRFIFR